MKKIVIIFLLVLLFVLGGVGIFFLYNSSNKENNTSNISSSSKLTSEEVVSSSEVSSTTVTVTNPVPENPTETKKKDLFEAYYGEAESILNEMTINEKVGQIFINRYNSNAINEINNYNPGGYILFGRDFKEATPTSVSELLTKLQGTTKYGLILGVDEEGGTVTRVSSYKAFRASKFLSPQDLYRQGGMDLVLSTEDEKDHLLKSIGLNWCLSPVADVSTNSSDFIYLRSFGLNGTETASYISKVVTRMNANEIVSTLKHFPGYGNNVDTHTGIAIDNRSLESFREQDFLPFASGIKAGSPTILVSHNIINAVDSNYPASLSLSVHNILRNELEYSGIIMTDDLAMDAVKKYVANGEAATLAINSGNDMIITSNLSSMYSEVLANVAKGVIKESTIDTAVKRILAFKLAYKII